MCDEIKELGHQVIVLLVASLTNSRVCIFNIKKMSEVFLNVKSLFQCQELCLALVS